MHTFLQGSRNIGKSTVISKTLDILAGNNPVLPGGFFSWNGGADDPNVYMRPARSEPDKDRIILAVFDSVKGGLVCDVRAFEKDGVRILRDRAGSNLIIMDELGYLERDAPLFRKAVLEILDEEVPVLGVMRLGDFEWHDAIKQHPLVRIYEVNEKNRDTLPHELAARISLRI